MRFATIGGFQLLTFVAIYTAILALPLAPLHAEEVREYRERDTTSAGAHWSFQPIVQHETPDVADEAWPTDAIDRFILARLESAGIAPAEDAGPRTLIRRTYFDLIGLPPPPEEVEAFVADDSPNRFARLIDRLLASPRFGERWGRHWLDVVRYAESSGREFNFTYLHAWSYRDYVIDSLNADTPYDRFVTEQLAGDLIPTDGEPFDNAHAIATGILAIGPKRHNSGSTDFRAEIVDDQIDVVTRAFMGLTVACAKCHDHKFDPIPQTDYYALAGIFESTQPLYGTIQQKYSNHPTEVIPFGDGAIAQHQAAQAHEAKINALKSQSASLQKKIDAIKATWAKENQDGDVDAAFASFIGTAPSPEFDKSHPVIRFNRLRREIVKLAAKIEHMEQTRPPRPKYACAVRDRNKPVNAKLAVRGNPRQRTDEVPRGFLSQIAFASPPQIPDDASGRLQLTQWLTSRDNPLTARVMVNRVWHHLFGEGLVATVDNFGALGRSPTHPKLLDHLAAQFMEDDWSIKRLIRSIMLTRTYRLSGSARPRHMEIDPDNRLLGRASLRRLEVEAIRDAMLQVSGNLDLARPNGSTVTSLGDRLVRGIPLHELQPPSRHRSIYLPVVRDYLPEMFDLFDFPSPSLVSGNRAVTTVPAQELFLQNSPFVVEQAQASADRVLAREGLSDVARIDWAYRLVLSRPATSDERRAVAAFINKSLATTVGEEALSQKKRRQAAWYGFTHSLLASAEFRHLVDID